MFGEKKKAKRRLLEPESRASEIGVTSYRNPIHVLTQIALSMKKGGIKRLYSTDFKLQILKEYFETG
ncbi:hypothetical protein OXV57_01585, partial [Bacteroides fragilis]|nr:hypothetical protein [Bacteroides fragilis]